MKSIAKERTTILAILGMTLLSNFLFCYSLDFYIRADNHSLKDSSVIHFKSKNLKASKISGIIYINNNWTDAKNIGMCSGSGTYSDPYLIKNLIIDGGNTSNCIKIQNSSVYFRIENCTLFNAGTDWSSEYAGILLNHTRNGMVVNNNCSKNMYGIFLVSYSSNNTVYGNYANNNFYSGISLNTFCSNNTISRNNADNNSVFGMSISWNSHNNIISKNNATKNKIGLDISSFSKFNGAKDNNFSYNAFPEGLTNGIRISRAENNSLIKNFVIHNGWDGIQVYESNFNLFLNNTINQNGNHGIASVRCKNNMFSGNFITLNGQYGANFEESEDNIVKFNNIKNHNVGIYLDDLSSCNEVSNNSFFGNGVNIQDFQKPCVKNGTITPPIDVLFISLAIIGIMILITGAILALRSLLRIRIIRYKIQLERNED